MDLLKLRQFGIHKKKDFEFKPGINVIKGLNRTGKTWILESICYGYFGKTKSSKIEKIVNYDADKASVEILNDLKIKRSRTRTSTKLDKPSKTDLEKKVNLKYEEFLRIFYISSQESFKLFEPSYCRDFLIKLFNLERYAKVYQRLRLAKQNLEDQIEEGKKVNTALYEKRAKRVVGIQTKWKEVLKKIHTKKSEYDTIVNKIYSKRGQATSKLSELKSRANLISKDKCPTCRRPFEKSETEKELETIKAGYKKVKQIIETLEGKLSKCQQALRVLEGKESKVRDKILRCNSIYATIKEKGKEVVPRGNFKRIKELEEIIPVFKPTGFPSYLLQIYVPVIQETANKLLRMIFPDMELEIRTSKPDSNNPDLKIFIIRYGEEEEQLTDCSGAETVIINLCLRLGIMVIFKQLHQTCVDFMLIDEGLEKLDDEVSIQIISLLNNFIAMGYINQVIMVTHKDILKNLEDVNYIELTRGGQDEHTSK